MLKCSLAAAIAVLTLAACGGHPSFKCDPVPGAHAGACVHAPAGADRATVGNGARGLDVSHWNSGVDFRTLARDGYRFVYVSGGDGYYHDPTAVTRCREARVRGLDCGVYWFMRGGYGPQQAQELATVTRQAGANLPPALDVEVPGAYSTVCPAASYLYRAGFKHVVTYTSPGLSEVHAACGTLLWTATWGTGGYPFGPWRSYVLHQYCGTCHINGVAGEVDLDVDHGLLALAHRKPAPKPSKAQLRRLIAVLHGNLERHHCKTRPARRYRRLCTRWKHAGDRAHHELGRTA